MSVITWSRKRSTNRCPTNPELRQRNRWYLSSLNGVTSDGVAIPKLTNPPTLPQWIGVKHICDKTWVNMMIVYDIRYTKQHDGDVLVILLDPWETLDMDLEQIDQTLQLALMNPNSQIPTTCHEINEMESFWSNAIQPSANTPGTRHIGGRKGIAGETQSILYLEGGVEKTLVENVLPSKWISRWTKTLMCTYIYINNISYIYTHMFHVYSMNCLKGCTMWVTIGLPLWKNHVRCGVYWEHCFQPNRYNLMILY